MKNINWWRVLIVIIFPISLLTVTAVWLLAARRARSWKSVWIDMWDAE